MIRSQALQVSWMRKRRILHLLVKKKEKKTWNKTELLSWGSKSSVELPQMSLCVFVLVGVCQLGEGCTRPPQGSSQESDGLMMFLVVLMGTIKGSTCLSIN